jgi:hypothetical protein
MVKPFPTSVSASSRSLRRRQRQRSFGALEVGYRHIDTAAQYGNQQGVLRGFAASASIGLRCTSPAGSATRAIGRTMRGGHWTARSIRSVSTENFEIFDFELPEDEIAAISALNRGEPRRTGPNPDAFAYIPH